MTPPKQEISNGRGTSVEYTVTQHIFFSLAKKSSSTLEVQVIGNDYVMGSWQQFSKAILGMLSATIGDCVLDLDIRNGE